MFKLLQNCTHFTRLQSNALNSPSQASAVHEPWTWAVQAGFRKGRGTRDQIANIHWIIEKTRVPELVYFCFIDYTKSFDCVVHNKLWKILKEMGIPVNLTCLLRNPNEGQEATVRTGHGTTDWFQIRKGVHQGCILSPCLFNLYANTSWEILDCMKHTLESRLPGEIAITSDMQMTLPLWRKNEEELKSLLKVKEESEKVGLKLNIQKTKIMTSGPITSW